MIEIMKGEHPDKKKQMILESCKKELIRNLFTHWKEAGLNVEAELNII